MTLHAIQSEIVAQITARPVGSPCRVYLMTAADLISRAIEADEYQRERDQ